MTHHLQSLPQQKTKRLKVPVVAEKAPPQGPKSKVSSVHDVTHLTPNSATTTTTASHSQGISARHVEDTGQKVGLCATSLLAVVVERTRRWSHQGSHVTPKTLVPPLQNLVASNSFILFLLPWTFTLEGYPSLGFTIITLQPLTTTFPLLETLLVLLHVSTLILLLAPPHQVLLLLSIITLFLTMVQSKVWALWMFIVALPLPLSLWVL